MDESNLPSVWQAVCRLETRPPYAWLRDLTLVHIMGNTATVAPTPGNEHLLNFAGGPKGEHIGVLLQRVLGRPMKISVVERATRRPNFAQSDDNSGAGDSAGDDRVRQDNSRAAKMQRAHQLPLVQEVMDIFAADLVDVREEQQPLEIDESAGDEAASDAPPRAGKQPSADPDPLMDDEDDESE